jgi:hypothetical protein
MNCKYKTSFMPRCEIVPHPNRPNIEYCRVCEEWRNVNDVGDGIPGTFGLLLMIAIALLLVSSVMQDRDKNPPSSQPLLPEYSQLN